MDIIPATFFYVLELVTFQGFFNSQTLRRLCRSMSKNRTVEVNGGNIKDRKTGTKR